MRLLNTKTGRFKSFNDPCEVRYAILSHVWSKDGGQKSFQEVEDLIKHAEADSDGSVLHALPDKVKFFCEVAQEHGFDFCWADFCCIDRTSSSELSEAITSMYDWYRCADTCFAFLHDVDISKCTDAAKTNQAVCDSHWFYRGWTLQELLAPSILLFLSSNWVVIASKQTCAAHINTMFHIDQDVLTFKRPLDEVSVAHRMSWASSRSTTRKEDEAYCLMGIFGVNIPVMYGEGRHAFVRLQEEIIRTIPDQSIYAWGRILEAPYPFQFGPPNEAAVKSMPNPGHTGRSSPSNRHLLASSPTDFQGSESSRIIHIPRDEFVRRLAIPLQSTYQVSTATAYGIHVELPLVAIVGMDHHDLFPTHLALLACKTQVEGNLLALLLRPQDGTSGFSVGATVVPGKSIASPTQAGFKPDDVAEWHYRAVYLSLSQVNGILQGGSSRMATLYLPHRHLRGVTQTEREHCRLFRDLRKSQDNFEVRLSRWSQTLLSLSEDDDRVVQVQGRRLHLKAAPWLAIEYIGPSKESRIINIQIGRCLCPLGLRGSGTVLLGVLVWSPHAQSSLEEAFNDPYHRLDHPVHLYSWTYHDGIASTVVELTGERSPTPSPRELTAVRLTLSRPSLVKPGENIFELGVEVASYYAEQSVSLPTAQVRRIGSRYPQAISPTRPNLSLPHSPLRSQTIPGHNAWPQTRVNSLPPVPFTNASLQNDVPSPPLTAATSRSNTCTSDWVGDFVESPLRDRYPVEELPISNSQQRSSTLGSSHSHLNGSQAFDTLPGRHLSEGRRTGTSGNARAGPPRMNSQLTALPPSTSASAYQSHSDNISLATPRMRSGRLPDRREDEAGLGQGGGTSKPEGSRGRRLFVDVNARNLSQTLRAHSAPDSPQTPLIPSRERRLVEGHAQVQQSQATSSNAYPPPAVEAQPSQKTVSVPVSRHDLPPPLSGQGGNGRSEGAGHAALSSGSVLPETSTLQEAVISPTGGVHTDGGVPPRSEASASTEVGVAMMESTGEKRQSRGNGTQEGDRRKGRFKGIFTFSFSKPRLFSRKTAPL